MLSASDESIKECGEKLQKLPKEKFGKETYIPSMLERLWGNMIKPTPELWWR